VNALSASHFLPVARSTRCTLRHKNISLRAQTEKLPINLKLEKHYNKYTKRRTPRETQCWQIEEGAVIETDSGVTT
jgi:hypothetical protein